MSRAETTLHWGQAHPFWDCYPSDEAQQRSGVDPEEMRSISVTVDQ